jgi:hypothetical protein
LPNTFLASVVHTFQASSMYMRSPPR